jgi:dihydrofolate reductase
MGSLMLDYITSLDSYGTAVNWPGFWGMETPEYLAWLEEDSAQDYTTLMGATTYREMYGFVNAMPDEPSLAAMAAMPKVVFSSTLQPPLEWENTELISSDAVEAVREMKRGSRDLRTLGSVSLGGSLLAARLVDRLRVIIFPVITGASGDQRLFEGYPDVTLELVEKRTFDGGLQLLEYVPTVLDAPPGAGG